jgi:two-component system, chemotaxis family, CheB/CheR fusion protein
VKAIRECASFLQRTIVSVENLMPVPEAFEAAAVPAFSIVGVGASAGGVEAVAALLKNITNSGMAFVVVQHLDPHHTSMLPEILSRWTAMSVLAAEDGTTVEPGHVYVIPPNADLGLVSGVLRVRPLLDPQAPRLTIDVFFRALAEDWGPRAIGVILSGTGTDGTFGLTAIKASGGVTFVQDPASAKYDAMPRHVLSSGCADFSLPPEAIARELARIEEHHHCAEDQVPAEHMTDVLGQLLQMLRKAFRIDLTRYKQGMVRRRIERRMAIQRIERPEQYLAHVRSDPAELRLLHKDMLIGVTSFFRDKEPFEALKSTVFSAFQDMKAGRSIRVWVPGCSTGEEPFSIAIVLFELLGERVYDLRIQIFGTDVDVEAIRRARLGRYALNIALDVSQERLDRFFVKRNSGYQISRAIREVVVFSAQNVATDRPFSHLDLVSCRNLLIYFQPILQKKALRTLHSSLNPGGYLLLGRSETVGDAPDLFSLADKKNKLYAKKTLAIGPDLELLPPPSNDMAREVTSDEDPRIRELEDELGVTRDYLETTIGALEAANEELMFSNEDLQAANEVLRAANEELETTQEDLQCSNQELITVNDELETGMNDLSQANEDLHNQLAGIGNAVVIIGRDLRIRRFTRTAERMLGLGPQDVARSVSSLDSFFGRSMDAIVSETIRTHASSSDMIQASDRRWYSMRIVPYETLDDATQGAIILLRDIDARKRHADRTRDAAEYAKTFLDGIPHPLLMLDEKQRIVWANRLFYGLFETAAEETIGTLLGDLGTGEWTDATLQRAVAATVASGSPFKGALIRHVFPNAGPKTMRVNGNLLPASASEAALVLLSIENEARP